MPRGSKPAASANDGMSWLALMPFPAFTPLNWWALTTPRNALLATLSNTRLALDAWRAGADGLRAMARVQQDEALNLLTAQVDGREDKAPAQDEARADGASAEDVSEAAATLLVRPMVEATRAYSRVGRAFIVAQRDTMRAWTQGEQPH